MQVDLIQSDRHACRLMTHTQTYTNIANLTHFYYFLVLFRQIGDEHETKNI